MILQKYLCQLCKKESLRSQHDSTSFSFFASFLMLLVPLQHLILRLFRTYLALYLVQSDTKIHTHQVIFATVCRTFIVPLLASSLSVSSYDTDAFYHFQQNEKSYCLFDKIWMIPNRDDPDIHILSKYISKYY